METDTGTPAPPPSIRLDGKVVLVVGGTRGLGREIALGCAEVGATVLVSGRKQDACDEAAAEIRRRHGGEARGYACHIGHWDEVEGLVEAVYGDHGRLDVLVNSAGMSPLYPSLPEVTEELYDKVFAVNLKGVFRTIALVGTRMVADGGGSIISLSSSIVLRATPTAVPYAGAKAGLEAMSVGFARAFGPAVRVNVLRPGPFRTDVTKAWDLEAVEAKVRQSVSLGRLGEPHEVVGAALYLASDASSYATGSVITLDGGGAR